MTDIIKRTVAALLTIGIVLMLVLNIKPPQSEDKLISHIDTVYVTTETIVPDAALGDSLSLLIDSLKVAASEVKIETKYIYDTIIDTIVSVEYIVLPITQRIYNLEHGTIYISGYEAKLDSVNFKITTKTVKETIMKTQKAKKIHIGVTAGYGVSVSSQPVFTPYIGVGVTYSLFSF